MIESVIRTIIRVYENDICCGLSGEQNFLEIKESFSELIICLTRLLLDVRYCSVKSCRCSPEWGIQELMKQHGTHYKKYLRNREIDFIENIGSGEGGNQNERV